MPTSTTDIMNKHLETLGLKHDDLNEDAIRVSYKKLALRWHPDRHNADPDEAKEKFIEVNEAYMALVEECRKRNKRKKARKGDDNPSSRRPFWAGSTPSTSTATSATTSSSRTTHPTTHTSTSTSSGTVKETDTPPTEAKDSHPAKPAQSRPAESSNSPAAKPGDVPRRKRSDQHSTARSHTRKEEPRRSGDRDPSHPPRRERSHPTSSPSQTAQRIPRPPRPSKVHPDTDSDSSSEEGSLHDRKHSRPHRSHERSKGKEPSLGEDDYEFIDLGTPLKPLRKPLSTSKDWIFPLQMTLEDLYYGATHRYRITRTLLSPAPARTSTGGSNKSQTVQIDVRVAPGWRAGTRIRVPNVGNQRADGSFQDIVFVVAEAPHPRFARAGDDLVLPVRVPWLDVLPGADADGESMSSAGSDDHGHEHGWHKFAWGRWHHRAPAHHLEHGQEGEDEVYVLGIDGEEYVLPIPRTLVDAAEGTRIFGAGMPVRKNGTVVGMGDLVIRWEFAFPESDKLQRSRWQTLKDAMHLRFQV